jgi:hypothetical protein
MPQDPGLPLHPAGASSKAADPPDAKTESRFLRRVEPQWGHLVPLQSLDRTRTSLSFAHFSQ